MPPSLPHAAATFARALLVFTLGLAAVMPLPAAAQSAAQQAQQQRMRDCNAEARQRSLSGDSRKSFMRTCLSRRGGAAIPAPASAGN